MQYVPQAFDFPGQFGAVPPTVIYWCPCMGMGMQNQFQPRAAVAEIRTINTPPVFNFSPVFNGFPQQRHRVFEAGVRRTR
jgi:hypothetical protein